MGTSQSKPDPKSGSPLVPSWANQDPVIDPQNVPVDNQPFDKIDSPDEVIEPRRLAGMRRSLKQFMATGDRTDGRKALGHYSRGSAGSGASGARRLGRAARIGGDVISAISRAASGHPVSPSGFDLRTLAGLPVAEAVDAIVDAFCPPGIIDEDTIRAAVGEALTEALAGLDQFDPESINDYTVLIATRSFIAELVFGTVSAEQGQAAENVPPQQAIARENDLRSLVKEVTDVIATPVIQGAGASLSQERVAQLITQIVTAVFEEMSTWE